MLVADADSFEPPSGHAMKRDDDGLWRMVSGQVYVHGEQARLSVVTYIHNLHFHSGMAKTSRRLKQLFYWKGQQGDVSRVINGCQTCQSVKVLRRKLTRTRSVSQSVPCKLHHVQVDFVWGLPIVTRKRDTGFMSLVDVFSKFCVFVPVPFNIDSEYCANIILDKWVRYFGAPAVLQSDQDVRFTSALYEELAKHMGVDIRFSAPYHAQSQGVVERLNGVAVAALRAHVLDKGTHANWHEILPWLGCVLNSNCHSATSVSPYECVFGKSLETVPGMLHDGMLSSVEQKAMQEFVKDKLSQQAVEQSERLDGSVDEAWDPQVGDLVWLSSDHLKWKKQAKAKLIPKYMGPFKVMHKPGPNAVRLELPNTWHCRSTWNVGALKPHVESVWSKAPVAADWSEEILEMMDEDQTPTDSVAPAVVDPSEGVKFVKEVKRGTRDKWLVRFCGDIFFQDNAYAESEVRLLPGGAEALNSHESRWQQRPRRGT